MARRRSPSENRARKLYGKDWELFTPEAVAASDHYLCAEMQRLYAHAYRESEHIITAHEERVAALRDAVINTHAQRDAALSAMPRAEYRAERRRVFRQARLARERWTYLFGERHANPTG